MNRRMFLSCVASSTVLASCYTGKKRPDRLYNNQEEWEKAFAKHRGDLKNPAYTFTKDDPALPNVLLIGDSISIGYTQPVRQVLAGKTNLHRIPENARDTGYGLHRLDYWLDGRKWDLIHFNWGLHDLKYFKNGKLDLGGNQIRTVEDYRKNLEVLVRRLKKTGTRLIWANTTPIPEGSNGRISGDEIRYNAAARSIMIKYQIPINDLYSAVFPRLAELQRTRNVHFTQKGYAFLGEIVARQILSVLKKG